MAESRLDSLWRRLDHQDEVIGDLAAQVAAIEERERQLLTSLALLLAGQLRGSDPEAH